MDYVPFYRHMDFASGLRPAGYTCSLSYYCNSVQTTRFVYAPSYPPFIPRLTFVVAYYVFTSGIRDPVRP